MRREVNGNMIKIVTDSTADIPPELESGVTVVPCYIEFGGNQIAEIYVNFLGGPKPSSDFKGATAEGVANKRRFGSSRAARWFGL